MCNYVIRKMILLNCGYTFEKKGLKKYFYKLVKAYASFFSIEKLHRKYKKNAIKYNTSNCKKVSNLGGSYGYNKESIPSCYIENVVELKFEGDFYAVPQFYKQFLVSVYGDYNVLPPKEERVNRHTLVNLDLGYYLETVNKNRVC